MYVENYGQDTNNGRNRPNEVSYIGFSEDNFQKLGDELQKFLFEVKKVHIMKQDFFVRGDKAEAILIYVKQSELDGKGVNPTLVKGK